MDVSLAIVKAGLVNQFNNTNLANAGNPLLKHGGVIDETKNFRRGGWSDANRVCLVTNQRRGHPTFAIDSLGFRVANSLGLGRLKSEGCEEDKSGIIILGSQQILFE